LGAEWIENQLKNGPVYVHCALGHGRSTTFVAAYLNRAGKASGVEDSLSIIQSRRPSIDLSPSQKQALQQLFPS
ncbi:serine/threonine protein phosphatase, partial [bacterium]